MKTLLVAGARPNFMKIAPIYRASLMHPEVDCRIVHTGRHYDQEMSTVFFEELGIPEPSFHLGAGSGSHAVQTAKLLTSVLQVATIRSKVSTLSNYESQASIRKNNDKRRHKRNKK